MEVDPATEYLMTELSRNRERSHHEDFPRYLQRQIRKYLNQLSKFKRTDVANILTMFILFIICSLLMLFICLIPFISWLYCDHFKLKVHNLEYYFLYVYSVQVWVRDHHHFHCVDHIVWEFSPRNYISPTKTKTKWYLNRYLLDVGVATQLFEAALPLSSSIAEMRSNRNLQSRRGSKDVMSAIVSSRNTGQGGRT